MMVSFFSIIAGLGDDAAEDVDRTVNFGLGLVVVPLVFIALAFLSRHRRAPIAILKSLGIWVAVAVVGGLLSIVLGLYLAFGIAGIFSLRADDPPHSYRLRMWGLTAGIAYTLLLVLIVPALGLFSAGTVPLIALGFADEFAERRAGAAEEEVSPE
jgi:uncharacterized membrane protein YdfJ with MMPL/SSD domain